MTAPVQVLVIGFEAPTFSGEVLAELERLREAGVVRLVDVLLLARDEDGGFHTLPPPPGGDPGPGPRGRRAARGWRTARPPSRTRATPGRSPTWCRPGSTGAVALIEHTWAAPLAAAIRAAGGRPLDEAWLAPADVERLRSLATR